MKQLFRRRTILPLLLSTLLAFPTHAAVAVPESAEAQLFSGYLFKLKEQAGVQLLSLPEETESVCPALDLYKAENLEDIQSLIDQGMIEYVQPDYCITLFDTPDDPEYSRQWELEMIGVQMAWDWALDGTGVRIGIIDSGINSGHEDLQGAQILTGYNYLSESTDTGDENGHGTFVAGVIAAQTDNGVGIAGIADGVEIVPLKAFAPGVETLVSHVVSAITDAYDVYDCDILNMSWGVMGDDPAIKDAIDYAADAGVILIAAVGNDGTSALYYPAAYENVIGVGAVGSNKSIASFSQYNNSVEIVAPGKGYLGLSGSDAYKTGNGTSYACPAVSAMAALMLQADPDLTAQELRALFADSAEDLGEEGKDEYFGYGLVTIPAVLTKWAGNEPLTLKASDGQLQVSGRSGLLERDICVFAAVYRADGKMLACYALEHALDMEEIRALPDTAAYGKLLFVKKNLVPVSTGLGRVDL